MIKYMRVIAAEAASASTQRYTAARIIATNYLMDFKNNHKRFAYYYCPCYDHSICTSNFEYASNSLITFFRRYC